jgi:hypothetical protein
MRRALIVVFPLFVTACGLEVDPLVDEGTHENTITNCGELLQPNQVAVFMDANYEGSCATFSVFSGAPGSYWNISIDDMFPNDAVSSILVGEDVDVSLFEHEQFSGARLALTSNTPYVGDFFNDRTTSLRVTLKSRACSPSTQPTAYEAVLYSGGNFSGDCATFGFDYAVNYIGYNGFANDDVESVKVGSGLKLLAASDVNLWGTTEMLTGNVPSLSGTIIRPNRLSSFRIDYR